MYLWKLSLPAPWECVFLCNGLFDHYPLSYLIETDTPYIVIDSTYLQDSHFWVLSKSQEQGFQEQLRLLPGTLIFPNGHLLCSEAFLILAQAGTKWEDPPYLGLCETLHPLSWRTTIPEGQGSVSTSDHEQVEYSTLSHLSWQEVWGGVRQEEQLCIECHNLPPPPSFHLLFEASVTPYSGARCFLLSWLPSYLFPLLFSGLFISLFLPPPTSPLLFSSPPYVQDTVVTLPLLVALKNQNRE